MAAYVEQWETSASKPTAEQHLTALRMLFDWLVNGQTLKSNPAHAVRAIPPNLRAGIFDQAYINGAASWLARLDQLN